MDACARNSLYKFIAGYFVAGVPEVPVDCPGVAAPGALNVPEVVGAPGALGSRDVEPVDAEPPEVGALLEGLAAPDADPAAPELPLPLVAGVPDVPVDWPGTAAPGALYVPEVVGEPGAFASRAVELDDLPELIPEEEPEVVEPDFLSADPIAPQAPSTKTQAKGMIHLFMK